MYFTWTYFSPESKYVPLIAISQLLSILTRMAVLLPNLNVVSRVTPKVLEL